MLPDILPLLELRVRVDRRHIGQDWRCGPLLLEIQIRSFSYSVVVKQYGVIFVGAGCCQRSCRRLCSAG